MKTKLIVIAGILLMLGGCKNENPTPTEIKPTGQSSNNNQPTQAKVNYENLLELDSDRNLIYATLFLDVQSRDFNYIGLPHIITTAKGYKGIAYRYMHTDGRTFDNGESEKMPVVFAFRNPGWRIGDNIRMMSLNENKEGDFKRLLPYFEERLDAFEDRTVTYNELREFNTSWNRRHLLLRVSTYDETKPGDSLAPRLTKKDIILSLTERK